MQENLEDISAALCGLKDKKKGTVMNYPSQTVMKKIMGQSGIGIYRYRRISNFETIFTLHTAANVSYLLYAL